MLRGRKKSQFKKLAQKARDRAHPPTSPPRPASTLKKSSYEMACICGQRLRIGREYDRRRCVCPACRRKFSVSISTDSRTGESTLCPLYLDDSVVTGTTYVADMPTPLPAKSPVASPSPSETKEPVLSESRLPPVKPERHGVLDDEILPQPPARMYFFCPCGCKLLARTEMYDRRVRCPECQVRMIVSVVYDAGAKMFDIKPVRVSDPPAGDTRPAEKV